MSHAHLHLSYFSRETLSLKLKARFHERTDAHVPFLQPQLKQEVERKISTKRRTLLHCQQLTKTAVF